MAKDPSEIASTAADEISARGWTGFIRDFGIGGIFLALVYAIINGIQQLGEAFLAPVRAFVLGLANYVSGSFGAPVRVVDAGAAASVTSFVDGAAAALGPAAFPVAMLSAVSGLYIFLWFWRNVRFSPLDYLRRRG